MYQIKKDQKNQTDYFFFFKQTTNLLILLRGIHT